MSKQTNPYDQNSLGWRIWEEIKSNKLLVESYTGDIERYTAKRSEALKQVDNYEEMLKKFERLENAS